ncbi:unnamed protein product [Moneuplotes crassus]|uniref:Uncharacterized protein n=1 Tax=Euplotes crassus TaxID=5936 RepID=A0AAD1UCH2_EUPCR|nr:unnamed protein product [Moneuplotes crassus]
MRLLCIKLEFTWFLVSTILLICSCRLRIVNFDRNGKDQKFDKDAFQRKLGVETPNNEESKGYLTGIPQDAKSMTSNESHPYMQFQKAAGENNEYLPQIPNWEGVKTFILPKEYALREFDAIQDHIEKEFNERNMRNILCENQYEYAKVHKCRRFNECLCRVFARDLLQLAYYKRVENVHKYLERFFLKPQVYLPFPELLLWLQLEIGRRNFKQAEAIMKKYIAYTTNLINDETKNVVSLELKKSSGPKDPWKAKPELLDLYESQYYKLIDVYLFDILLPDRGYDKTKEILLKEIAMEKSLKLKYLDKIGDYYCSSIRETSLIHGTEALQQLNKATIKDQMEHRVEEIKNVSNDQQGDTEEEDETVNPLFQNTFNRQRFEKSKKKDSTEEKGSFLDVLRQKMKVTPKTFITILSLVIAIWLWRGGYRKLRQYRIFKFALLHIFGIKSK